MLAHCKEGIGRSHGGGVVGEGAEGPGQGEGEERVLFIGTQFSIFYTSMYSPAEAATPRA